MAIFKAADLQTAEEANSLSQQIQRLPGVRDCSANPESRLVAITYYAHHQIEDQLKGHVQQPFKQVSEHFQPTDLTLRYDLVRAALYIYGRNALCCIRPESHRLLSLQPGI